MVRNERNGMIGLRQRRYDESRLSPAPRLLLVTSAREQLGSTTIALHLATSLVDQGARVVLMNLDRRNSPCSIWQEITGESTASELITSQRDIHEFLSGGPAGLLVIPPVWPVNKSQVANPQQTLQQLTLNLHSLGRHADWVVIDLGQEMPEDWLPLYKAASDWCLVTSADEDAVTETYALIKWLTHQTRHANLHVLLNRITRSAHADAHSALATLENSCREFLQRSLGITGIMLDDPALATISRRGRKAHHEGLSSETAHELLTWAQRLLAQNSTINLRQNWPVAGWTAKNAKAGAPG